MIRKEQEATLKGFQIGEVLHSAYFDLEFPTIAKAKRKLLWQKRAYGCDRIGVRDAQGFEDVLYLSRDATGLV